jgi:hypothetical protein
VSHGPGVASSRRTHGPEPAQRRVLPYPGGSLRVLLHSIAELVVSSRVLLVPELRDTAVTSRGAPLGT